jgi:hypothetical protein
VNPAVIHRPFILDLTTSDGRVCERFETYDEARRRLEQFPAESLIGLAFIFEEFADGSERVVLEDGKPLQFHRAPVEEAREIADEPLPLVDETDAGAEGNIRIVEPPPGWSPDLPLSE